MPPKMASSAIITTAAIATVTSTTMVLVLTSALDGHTTFFSSLFVSRKNLAMFAPKPFRVILDFGPSRGASMRRPARNQRSRLAFEAANA